MIKKVLSVLVAFLLIQTSVFALSIPKQDESIYVNDYAFVLSETTENELVSINQTSDYETGGYVVVATFDFVDEDLYDFSYRLFNEWGIGSSEYNNGILLVLDIGNDNYCYILGKGIESVLTDSEAWDIIDNYMEPDFAVKNYDQAVLKTTKQFLNVIADSFVIESNPEQNDSDPIITGIASVFASILLFCNDILIWIIFIAIISIVICSILESRRYHSYGPTYHRPIFRPSRRRYSNEFLPRPNREFNDRRYNSFGGGSSFGGSRPSFGGSRPSSFGGSRSHHSGGSSRGAGGTRR